MAHHPDSRLSPTALLALLVGIFSFVCFFVFWGIAGIAAIILGSVALSEIKRSEGRQHGQGLAIAGLTLGVLHLCGIIVAAALWIGVALRAKGAPAPAIAWVPPPPAAGGSGPKAPAPPGPEPDGMTRDTATRATRFGLVTLVDPGAGSGSLDTVLREEKLRADAEHQKLLLWISSPEFSSCNGVSVALGDRRLQSALANVRVLRLNVSDFYVELGRLGVPVDVLPGFVLLGPSGRPVDYVSGGEWDADVAENIAPVLGKFIRGRYVKRRNPWQGPVRGDETSL